MADPIESIRALWRGVDWAATPIGASDTWTPALRSAVSLTLDSGFPACVYAGPEFVMIYNARFSEILGRKHPSAFGQPASNVWSEIWAELGPELRGVFSGGASTWHVHEPFTLERNGSREEAFFTYAISTVRDDDGVVAAVHAACVETTAQVVAERQIRRLQNEDERHRSQLERILSQAPVAVAVLDGPELVFSVASERYHALVNHRLLIGLNPREAFPELEGQGIFELLDSVYQSGESATVTEARLMLRPQPDMPPEERVFDYTFQALRNAFGQPSGVAIVAVDVTDKVATREVAAASERQLRTLADAIPTLAWTATADGFIDWYNARWYEYTGTRPEDMVGWGWQSVHDPKELPRVLDTWSGGIATGQRVEMTFPLRGADGTFRQFLTRVTPLLDPDGRVVRWFGTNTDVDQVFHARQAAERAVSRTETLQKLTAALAGVRSLEDVTRVLVGEAAAVVGARTAMLALRHEDGSGGRIVEHSGLTDDVLGKFGAFVITAETPLATCVRTARPIYAESSEGPGGVLTMFPVVRDAWNKYETNALVTVPLIVAGEAVAAITFTFSQPTTFSTEDRAFFEAFALQGALSLERARLFESEKQALDELRSAKEQSEKANRAKSDFLAAMSHELRTPLNAIGGYAQILDLEVHGPVNLAQRQAISRIIRAEEHLLSLINDVLNFAKIEAGRVDYDMQDIALAEFITGVKPLIEPQLDARGTHFESHVPDDIVIRADPERLQQIMLNLCSNAIKFTADGGMISIGIGHRDGQPDNVVWIRVTDTGIGIPRERQDSIFDPFIQVHRSLTRSTEGTGLGLAISRDLARGMGGDLRVRSEVGRGSTFTLSIRKTEERQMDAGIS